MRGILSLLAAIAAILALPSAAQDLPARPDGPVLDAAGVIPDAQEAQLDAQLRQYNANTGRAVIVATVPSLEGLTIEMYAVELFETWGISGAETDEGVLLLVAPEDRALRIETGYGTTARLTDALSGRIIRETIVPAFKSGDFGGGIVAGVGRIIEILDMDPATAEAIAEAEAAAAAQSRSDKKAATVGGAVFWVIMLLGFMFLFGRRSGGRRRRYGAADAVGDIILWNALGSAIGHASRSSGSDWGGGGSFGGGGGFGGFGGGMSGGGGASGSW